MTKSDARAWVTLLTKASYLPGVYPLLVIITPTVSSEVREVLSKAEIAVKEIEYLEPKGEVNVLTERFKDTWCKLRVFELTEYEPMDSLFDLPLPPTWIAANHACTCNPTKMDIYLPDCIPELCPYTPLTHPSCLENPTPVNADSPRTHTLLNSGLVILYPSDKLFDEIKEFLYTSPLIKEMAFPDQDLLAEFFKGKWKPIGWQWNAIKTLGWLHPEIYREEEVVNLHYIVDKPWEGRPGPDSPDLVTHGWWWVEWDDLMAEWTKDENKQGVKHVVEGLIGE
ncbi:Glycosyl transferase, family 8-glycogenin [Phaffia rhodozyma]|uniref:Glycosyl transferase, family 8-glycogenin n=1 Tax=Phaffia rhodozyma TaxID=264483 RepID=A0A0F7SNU8_PHARH|nr:Glycosyl transferase, family 8-glycogenin [Phaffia rhodozyma]